MLYWLFKNLGCELCMGGSECETKQNCFYAEQNLGGPFVDTWGVVCSLIRASQNPCGWGKGTATFNRLWSEPLQAREDMVCPLTGTLLQQFHSQPYTWPYLSLKEVDYLLALYLKVYCNSWLENPIRLPALGIFTVINICLWWRMVEQTETKGHALFRN